MLTVLHPHGVLRGNALRIAQLQDACADPENFLRGAGPNSQKGSDGKFQHGKN